MKCPHCGNDTKDEKICGHCGKGLPSPGGMEVRYKDFKVSELLDIKMPGRTVPKKESAKRDAARDVVHAPRVREKPAVKKRSRVGLTAVIIFLAAAGFLLLKLLLRF